MTSRPGRPKGMRLILRKEQSYPGAQLRLTGTDGMRLTRFAADTSGRPIAELDLRLFTAAGRLVSTVRRRTVTKLRG
ncbi:hypothetical protein ABZ990_24720 [Streptomyces sp. NPDC046203]|uniref:hypothetical protein n=1 Tax=Streptomyces sp. NPDC046203 TaxID=3154602 RepID=UPI0033D214F8